MKKSRLLGAVSAALLTFITVSANAASISFGVPTDLSTCSEVRHSDCSRNISRNVPINIPSVYSSPTGIIIRGQASANSNVTGAATADTTITYNIPYSVSRNVSVTPGPGGAVASVEAFDLDFSGIYRSLLITNDDILQVGGTQSARAFNASITSLGGFFSTISMAGHSLSGDNTFGNTLQNGGVETFTPGLNASGLRRSEADTDAQGLPIDFRVWDDFLGPQAQDYSQPFKFTQTFDDVLSLSFRLHADSRASGLFSADGGSAIACAGLGSAFGGNILNGVVDTGCTGLYGLFMGVEITSQGTYQTVVGAVPVPAAVWLFGSGLLGLIGVARRKKA